MLVRSIGNSLMVILPDLLGKKITNWFDLKRPLIAFKFQTVNFNIFCYVIETIYGIPFFTDFKQDKQYF